jgi:urea transporter
MAQRNPPVGVVDTLLRGIGQVMFQNNPLTGLLFLVGIFVNSLKFGGAALLGVAASTLAAYLLGADRGLIRNGLFGFNGVLVGIGLAFFLEFDFLLAVYIVLGAVVSTIVMMALSNLLTPWDMPALTAPFVLTAWLLLFAVYQFEFIRPTELLAPLVPDPEAAVQTELRELATGAGGLTVANLAHGFFRGVGEVMFQDNLLTGVIFLVAILVNSRVSAAFAALGSALALLTASRSTTGSTASTRCCAPSPSAGCSSCSPGSRPSTPCWPSCSACPCSPPSRCCCPRSACRR